MSSFDMERLPVFQQQKIEIANQLHQLSAFLQTHDPDRATAVQQVATDLEALTFNVAVIGEFNRGKTTLINALLGRPGLLTAAPLPNTAVITRISATKPGEHEHYRVVFRDPNTVPITSIDLTDLAKYANDSFNNFNDKTDIRLNQAEVVEHIDLFLDSDLLRRSGIVLIDTPGLGAVSRAHQDVTERIIPTIHAALFVFMVDPPPGAAEIVFLRFSQAYISRFLFVMNDKHNLLQQSPTDANAVIAYAQRELEAAGIRSPQIVGLNPGSYLRGENGGFSAFWPILAEFLITGRGKEYLSDAIRKAQQHIGALDNVLARQIDDTDRKTTDLKAMLSHLVGQVDGLDARRVALLARVDYELTEIVTQLVSDIDILTEQIDNATNDAIDKAGIGMLRMMHIQLPEVIRQTVTGWLYNKSIWINTRSAALYQRVVNDLRELVHDYQAADLATVTIKSFELPRGIDVALGGDVALSLAVGIGIATGVALLDIMSTGGIGAISLVIGGAAGTGTAGAMLMQRIRASLKQAIHQSLPAPNESRTALSALIEGYLNEDSQFIPGLRERLMTEFAVLAETINSQIATTISEAWQPRLNELQSELDRRTSTVTNIAFQRLSLAKSRQQLLKMNESLQGLDKALQQL